MFIQSKKLSAKFKQSTVKNPYNSQSIKDLYPIIIYLMNLKLFFRQKATPYLQ